MGSVDTTSPKGEAARAENASGPLPRLNPFALPSDTTSRFVLLIVAVLSATLFAYSLLAFVLPPTQDRLRRAQACLTAVESIAIPENSSPVDRQRIVIGAQDDCRRPSYHWQAGIVSLGVAGVFVTGVVLYLLTPSWKIRRRHLVPFEEDDAPGLVQRFRTICSEAGLARPPTLVWNPLAAQGGALPSAGSAGRTWPSAPRS